MICHTTVAKYCKDYTKIENYEKAIADKTRTWLCHHRLEIAPFSGKNISVRRLIELGLYYNVSPNALIFMPRSVHAMLHGIGNKSRTGQPHTEETKMKISKGNKGKTVSEESKQKMSNAHKNLKLGPMSEDHKAKLSISNKGWKWWNDGKKSIKAKECPEGFVPGFCDSDKAKRAPKKR